MADKPYLGIERRRFSDAVCIDELERHIEERIKEHMANHTAEELKMMDRKFDELKMFFSTAFPDGNLFKHLEYHEEQIAYMKEQREFYADLKKRSVFWILTLALGGLGMVVVEYVKVKWGVPRE